MVELMGMRSQMPSFGTADNFPVKLEITAEDSLDDEFGPLNKRSRLSPSTPSFLQWSSGNNEFPTQPSHYNPLDEPSPLGLRLRKSPSLLDLIQMKLSQGSDSAATSTPAENISSQNKKDARLTATSVATEKLKVKASNFAASLLRIGSWEFLSRYEGDLVAKCYFHKSKLVWEVLEGGLKSKIEIQWCDIVALKANCPDVGPGTLTVVLSRPPLFFRETNPQPRKHTLWQAATDFTNGQASIHRQHFLQCPPGLLNKHFEKLIQRDNRLKFLSQQPEIVLDSPYFDRQTSDLENPDAMKASVSSQLVAGRTTSISSLSDGTSPVATELSSLSYEQWDTASPHLSMEAPSPSSVMDTCTMEGIGSGKQSDSQGLKNLQQLKAPGLRQSMSMTDLVNHIGHCISEEVTAGNIPSDKASECHQMLDNIAQILLSDTRDTQTIQASDEKSLMKRVNSLCCLLQDPAAASSVQVDGENLYGGPSNGKDAQSNQPSDYMHERQDNENFVTSVGPNDGLGSKQSPTISRKDSLGDLLIHLPGIASLSKFLFDIAEDDESQAR